MITNGTTIVSRYRMDNFTRNEFGNLMTLLLPSPS